MPFGIMEIVTRCGKHFNKMKNIKISFTQKEYDILRRHWNRNLNYGVGGTFGNGEDFVNDENEKDISDYRIAQKIAKKLIPNIIISQ